MLSTITGVLSMQVQQEGIKMAMKVNQPSFVEWMKILHIKIHLLTRSKSGKNREDEEDYKNSIFMRIFLL